jgi:hypothetical protein
LGDIFSNLGGQISKFGDIYKISHANIKFLKTFVPPLINVGPPLEGIVPLPVCPARRTLLVVSVSLSTQSPEFLSSRCETTELSVLVDWLAEPVDS